MIIAKCISKCPCRFIPKIPMRRRKALASGSLPLYVSDEAQASTDGHSHDLWRRRRRQSRSRLMRRRCSWYIFLPVLVLVVALALWAFQRPAGRFLTSSSGPRRIKCMDGSVGYLNDDYCDCRDGSDETNTSACSHVLVQHPVFSCTDGSAVIFASRVSDSIPDCPDGSDELSL